MTSQFGLCQLDETSLLLITTIHESAASQECQPMSRISIELQTASVEQVAAQLLTIMRENKITNAPDSYSPGSLESMLQWEFSPTALGIDVPEGDLKPPGGVFSRYGTDNGPEWLRTKFFESVRWLCEKGYIVHDQAQGSDDFAEVTTEGEAVEINAATMMFVISRPWAFWRSYYERSVFHLGIVRDDVVLSGTAFLISPDRFATSRHNLEGHVVVYIDQAEISSTNEQKHPTVDVAVFSLVHAECGPLVTLPLRNGLPGFGEEVAVLGFSPASPYQPIINLSAGCVETLSSDSQGNSPFIQVHIQSEVGYGGAPVIDQWGRVVGVVTKEFGETIRDNDARRDPVLQVVPVSNLRDLL